jgi:hypothetical protein
MDLYSILIMVHSGSAIFLLTLSTISVSIAVLIAVKPAVDHANKELVKKANVVGLLENIFAGIVTLTGLIVMFMGSWEFLDLWMWMSLAIIVFYSVALVVITKPARLRVAEDSSEVKTGLQVVLEIGHLMLLMIAFSLMMFRPM